MFVRPTVIILGAGASAEFGLPTGAGLLNRLLEMRPYDHGRELQKSGNLKDYDIASAIMQAYNQFPIPGLDDQELIEKANSTFESSIDLFSYNNNSVLETAKFYTSWMIQSAMIESIKKVGRFEISYITYKYRKDWLRHKLNDRRNWIADFVRKYTEDADNGSDINSDNVIIVSFNYDKIFKKSVLNFLESSERFSEAAEDIMPKIEHVYGGLEFLEEIHPRYIADQRDRIAFIKEITDSDEHIKRIRNRIADAEDIYCCGFSFDKRNVELIGLNETNARIYSNNYDGNLELSARLRKLGVSADRVISGTAANPMPLGRAVEQGFFSLHELQA